MDNKTLLITLMIVLICFIVMLAVLAIVFIIALRKRAPVVKVLMPSMVKQQKEEPDEDEPEEPKQEAPKEIPPQTEQLAMELPEPEKTPEEQAPAQEKGADEIASAAVPEELPDSDDDDDDDESATIVTETGERIRYDRSLTAKLGKLSNESKEWYTELKNELLSYEKIKDRMSWKRESFRLGRVTLARFTVRGKTLCLFFAVEPSGYAGTKYHVEDVSNVASTADTPTMYRIKSGRRMKYAKEMIAGIMKEIKVYKNPRYEAKDFFVPYEGDMALMQRGLIKRVITGSTRTFKIEELDGTAQAEAVAAETPASAAPAENGTSGNNGNQ